MKKNLLLTIGLVSALTLAACGSDDDASSTSDENQDNGSTETETTDDDSTEDEAEPEEDEEPEDLSDESTGNVGELSEDGSQQIVAEITEPQTLTTGDFTVDIDGIVVAEWVEVPEEMMDFYDSEPTGYVAFNVGVEHAGEETIDFYISQATLTTSTGEQLETDFLISDHIEGEFIGAVSKSGVLVFMLENSDPNEIESVRFLVDSPTNFETFDDVGEDIDETFEF